MASEDINLKNSEVIEKTISHQENSDVKENKDSTIMEIKSINDINEETLQSLNQQVAHKPIWRSSMQYYIQLP